MGSVARVATGIAAQIHPMGRSDFLKMSMCAPAGGELSDPGRWHGGCCCVSASGPSLFCIVLADQEFQSMISSLVSNVCSTIVANVPYIGEFIGQACSALVSLLQSLGL